MQRKDAYRAEMRASSKQVGSRFLGRLGIRDTSFADRARHCVLPRRKVKHAAENRRAGNFVLSKAKTSLLQKLQRGLRTCAEDWRSMLRHYKGRWALG